MNWYRNKTWKKNWPENKLGVQTENSTGLKKKQNKTEKQVITVVGASCFR